MAGKGCPVCAALGKGDNGFWVSVSTGEVAEVHLERRSRLPGYCIVVWRHGHVAEPGDLDPLQAGRYWAEVLAAGRAVRAVDGTGTVQAGQAELHDTREHRPALARSCSAPRYQDDPTWLTIMDFRPD